MGKRLKAANYSVVSLVGIFQLERVQFITQVRLDS